MKTKIAAWVSIIVSILLINLGVYLLQLNNSPIAKYLDSPFLLSLITLAAGLVTLYIYNSQKKDHKKDAANIIYLEITKAEKLLKQAKEGLEKGNVAENVLISPSMPTQSWTKYKYLFVRELKDDDWNAIDDFYNKCELYDQAVTHNSSMFQKNEEQIRINLTKFMADYAASNPINTADITTKPTEEKKWQKFVKATKEFQDLVLLRSIDYLYRPQKPVNDARLYLNNMNLNISQSNAIKVLKQLANI